MTNKRPAERFLVFREWLEEEFPSLDPGELEFEEPVLALELYRLAPSIRRYPDILHSFLDGETGWHPGVMVQAISAYRIAVSQGAMSAAAVQDAEVCRLAHSLGIEWNREASRLALQIGFIRARKSVTWVGSIEVEPKGCTEQVARGRILLSTMRKEIERCNASHGSKPPPTGPSVHRRGRGQQRPSTRY